MTSQIDLTTTTTTPPTPSSQAPLPPTKDAKQAAAYEKLRSDYDVGSGSLSTRSFIRSSRIVLLGVISTIVFNNLNGSLDPRDVPYFSIIMVSLTLLLFYIIKLLAGSRHFFYLFQHDRDWLTTIFGVAQSLRAIALYTLSGAFVTLVLNAWKNNHISTLGAVFGVVLIVLVINVVETIALK